jgi:glycerol-3-phosphate dehydrogenase
MTVASRRRLQTEVLVIGGGATGLGTAWDAALRGFDVVLVERSDLVEGTSGRFHGLLHSGGRYVVKDPVAAEECVVENALLRRLIPDCIEDTGGLFVTTPDDDPAYADRFLEGCRAASLPVEELEVAEALRREPRLNPAILRAFAVPDASIDTWKTAWSLARGATAHGARVLTYHRVVDLYREDGAMTGARVRDERTGDELDIEASFILNASGPWAAQILHLAGIEDVGVIPGKGIMIAMNHRLVNTVINRCVMPADGDILVPIRTVSVIGTTDIRAADPDDLPVTQAEVDQMLDDGERLVPGFREARALRVWAGARPLFQDARAGEVTDTRDVSRTHAVVDHRARDGVSGLLTMSGGKLTTFRMMAQDLVDAMCSQLGEQRPCRTHEIKPPGNEDGGFYDIGSRLRRRERTMADDELICECELIGRRRLEEELLRRWTTNLDDIRRSLRLGMGPCQGGFCMYRATGIMHTVERLDGAQAAASLHHFLQERWKGVWPILYGDQLRQARLDDWIFQGLLDVEHLPAEEVGA